ncbi:MAG: hypothetical protein F6J98_14705 [Moorea sp. SIO4G2]|nr:hypothetical protein [Moorena sp. SIO4G2]
MQSASGGNPQDRAGSPRPRCIANYADMIISNNPQPGIISSRHNYP